jgi:putative membrane protein insertion efficiency factor
LRCRFTPTCSRYAEVVIARDGLLKGGAETARRLLRCGPWTPLGTVDEP